MAPSYKTLCLCLSLFFLLFSATDATASPGYTAGISLSPGNTIALIAPASPSPESIAPTVKKLESLGFHTKIASSAYKRFGYLSGSDAERSDDLNALFADPSVNAILCLDGGYGSGRLLDKLDYPMIATLWHPSPCPPINGNPYFAFSGKRSSLPTPIFPFTPVLCLSSPVQPRDVL